MRRWLPWLALLLVAGGALIAGTRGGEGPPTEAARVRRVASEVRCPTCEGLSAAESDAPTSRAMRAEIRDRLRAGEDEGDIKAYLASRYGKDILIKPEARGLGAVVWALPVVVVLAAAGGLAVSLRRSRARRAPPVTPGDRDLVHQALSP